MNLKPNDHLSQTTAYTRYDYIFCGIGASASLLILELYRNDLLKDKKVLLIDQDAKTRRDKTFCFWSHKNENIAKDLNHLISHAWDEIELPNAAVIPMFPFRYNHISSIDLYQYVQQIANTCAMEKCIAKVDEIGHNELGTYVSIKESNIYATQIFDSRTPSYRKTENTQIHLFQSFVGWIIEVKEERKHANAFRFMDFNIEQNGFTQFVYILPFSPTQALVEVTRFGAEIIQEHEAELLLEQYIKQNFGEFKKLDVEQGCIPMSNCEIENESIPGITTLGSRNYKIKPSTGYAFKNMYYHARQLTASIKNGRDTTQFNQNLSNSFKGRFALYDALLLDILHKHPADGKRIFEKLLDKVKIEKILNFLDEKTSLKEDISIFIKLPWRPFLLSLFRKIRPQPVFQSAVLMLVSILLLLLGNGSTMQQTIGYTLFLIGLVAVGIPHGAVDHLLDTGKWDFKKAPRFIIKYLALSAAMGLFWLLSPPIALSIFLLYSAWHFGQADGKLWNMPPWLAMTWGCSMLFYILGTHVEETNAILLHLGGLTLPFKSPIWALFPWLLWAFYEKKGSLAITILWLTLSSALPLIFAFGLYFIGQHSHTSWKHLRNHLKMSNKRIWLHALPFHASAWLFLILFYFLFPFPQTANDMGRWSLFFIFISCISFPHSIAMHFLYLKQRNKANL